MSRTLWAFDLKRAVDEKTGKEIVPDVDNMKDGLFVCPKPFKASLVPRSESKASQVKEEWGKAREFLDEHMQWKTVPEGHKWRDYEPDHEDLPHLSF
jgi:hypothetical protein